MPSDRFLLRSAGCLALSIGVFAAGCMNDADLTEAITGRTTPTPVAQRDVMVIDAAPPVVDAEVIDAVPDMLRLPETCNDRDDDRDEKIDEDAPMPDGDLCCDGGSAPPCNGAPPGTRLPAGWARVPGRDLLVMVAPLSADDLTGDRFEDIARCTSLLAATAAMADGPVTIPDLYQAAALANAWSCATGAAGCYRIDGTLAELLRPMCGVQPEPPGEALTRDEDCQGAQVLSHEIYSVLTGRPPGEQLCTQCDAFEARVARATGVRALITGREWLWPDAPVDDSNMVIDGGGCGEVAICQASAAGPRGGFDPWGLRLVCPLALPGEDSLCTKPDGGGECYINE